MSTSRPMRLAACCVGGLGGKSSTSVPIRWCIPPLRSALLPRRARNQPADQHVTARSIDHSHRHRCARTVATLSFLSEQIEKQLHSLLFSTEMMDHHLPTGPDAAPLA